MLAVVTEEPIQGDGTSRSPRKEARMVPIIPVIATENRAYKRGERITPNGIVVHSTAANNTQLRRYVQPDPDGTIGNNQSGNHWNQAKAD